MTSLRAVRWDLEVQIRLIMKLRGWKPFVALAGNSVLGILRADPFNPKKYFIDTTVVYHHRCCNEAYVSRL